MAVPAIEYLGWLATAVFVGSYLCRGPETLKRVQMIGAMIWVVYGLLIQATPVVAANLLVFTVAGWTLLPRLRVPAVDSHISIPNAQPVESQPFES